MLSTLSSSLVKTLAWLSLTCVQTFASTVLKLAQHNNAYTFSPASSLVLSESIKALLSLLYLLYETPVRIARRTFRHQASRLLTLHMFSLAAIYCVNNSLMFLLFQLADPGSIALIKSASTAVSAILLYLVRRFKLSFNRWLVILIQMLGLIVAQYNACKGVTHLSPSVYALLLVNLLLSNIANVWNEHVVKSFSASLAVKNILLYSFGAILNLFLFIHSRITTPSTPSFWQGYGPLAILVVLSNALMGIAINAVYKYADALVKNIATTTTTVILLILSAFFFGGRSDIMVYVGAAITLLSTFLYFLLGAQENSLRELRVKSSS